ncbi:metallophosphoesterase family protein [Cytobacillus spongiae]|jgi:predicted MPP superfamily phosphohydrolase|uniref:metallophosphoesterase n=1 Tax=Cytobacillus spongiae TaxID=2901381 RepID=UPI001F4911EE|nr:metallophosphoesterase [Cytobacillus spongiae]UII54666.1 metallophosphoesterase family protein [Cytobacillus spongiae]
MEFILFVAALGILLLAYMVKEAFANRVVYGEMSFSEFPKSFGEVRIFFISDIHKRSVSEQLLEQVKESVDLVIIGGDLLEKGVPLSRVRQNIERLKKLGPTYFVWGNNDYEVDYHELDACLLECGVKILDNTAVSFESEEGDRFILLGVDDMNMKRDRLDLALLDAEEGFKILVSHNPRITAKVKKEHGISLVLSGHTHGGQIHILGFSPYKKGGLEEVGHTTLFISNGYGTTALPFRLGAKAEAHMLTITHRDDNCS